jgi:hypothetical protein
MGSAPSVKERNGSCSMETTWGAGFGDARESVDVDRVLIHVTIFWVNIGRENP